MLQTTFLWLALPALAFADGADSSPAVTIDAAMIRLIDQVEVPARDNGMLVGVMAREGLIVKEGELLGKIDDTQPKIALQKTEHELQIATRKAESKVAIQAAIKSREVAESDLSRSVEARKKFKESVSEAEIDSLRLKAEKAALEVQQAEEEQEIAGITRRVKQDEVETARAILEQRLVLAPWPGMVVQVHKRRGDWMQTGDKVVRLVRLDLLRVEGYVLPADLPRTEVGAPVRFIASAGLQPGQVPAAGSPEYRGKIVFVSPELDPVNAQIRVYAEIENPEFQLRPGQRGRLLIGGTAPEKVVEKTAKAVQAKK